MQGAWNDMLLVPAIAAFPELFPLPRVGMSHARWLNLFQKWIAPAAVPTTGWVGALRTLLCSPALRAYPLAIHGGALITSKAPRVWVITDAVPSFIPIGIPLVAPLMHIL